MIESDTIKLLRECDAGIKIGVASIEDVLDYVSNIDLKKHLDRCKNDHEKLENQIQLLLDKYHDDGKDPNAMAKSMSWLKTNMKLAVNESDGTVADLITDGCNMGVKSLSRYLNQYKARTKPQNKSQNALLSLKNTLLIA